MAKVVSLGIHVPVALPYLIREGILPHEPEPKSYEWQTYVFDDGNGQFEEEVVATKDTVVWSQARSVRNVYRFDLEGENVVQAILTTFPTTNITRQPQERRPSNSVPDGYTPLPRAPNVAITRGYGKTDVVNGEESEAGWKDSSRALVVFLKTKAHIYFLPGSNHVIDLPFEIERAFAAPRGLIIQRKPVSPLPLPPTPPILPAPQNSFFSSQLNPSSSYLQSPTLTKSFVSSQAPRPSLLDDGRGRLEALFQDVIASSSRVDDYDDASIYSLTSPLSEFGIISRSLKPQKHRLSGKAQTTLGIEFENLDAAEEIVYVSSGTQSHTEIDREQVILIVTANYDLETLTVWHAWYIEEKSLASLLKQRAAANAAKAKRRSSFLSSTIGYGTGTTTPATRHREPTRESLAGTGSVRFPIEPSAGPSAVTTSRKPTRQEEEAAMASQMDPDYQPTVSQQPARESRRISSMNADLRASQNVPNPSFGGVGSRRNTSFGGPSDRKSFGHRKSRGSTPGSVFSRSLDLDDDLMDVDSSSITDEEETVESVLGQIRATYDVAGAANVLGTAEEGLKRELMVRKLHSSAISSRKSSPVTSVATFGAVMFKDSHPRGSTDVERLDLYLHNRVTKDLLCLKLRVTRRPLWPQTTNLTHVAIPVVAEEISLGTCADIAKIRHDDTEAVILSGRGILQSPNHSSLSLLPPKAAYRVYNALEIPLQPELGQQDFGKNRTIPPPQGPLKLEQVGTYGTFDEVGEDGVHHRMRIQLKPDDDSIDQLLDLCEIVLPTEPAAAVRRTWCAAHVWIAQHPDALAGTASNIEYVAFVATAFSSVVRLLDAKARAVLNLSRVAAGKQRASANSSYMLRKKNHEAVLFSNSAWSWLKNPSPNASDRASVSPNVSGQLDERKDQLLPIAIGIAYEMVTSGMIDPPVSMAASLQCAIKLMLGLHVFREEQSLCSISSVRTKALDVAPIITQLGGWLSLDAWSGVSSTYYKTEGINDGKWAYIRSVATHPVQLSMMDEPISVFQWFEHALRFGSTERYPSLAVIAALELARPISKSLVARADGITPRIALLSNLLVETRGLTISPATAVEAMAKYEMNNNILETLPESVTAPLKEVIVRCEREPPTTWPTPLLQLVGREDLELDSNNSIATAPDLHTTGPQSVRDVLTICQAMEQPSHPAKTKEASRHAVSQLIFNEDRRLVEAMSLMHFNSIQVAECPRQPDWTDAHHFEQQRRVMSYVTSRMIALPAGDGMIHFDSQTPLLTEKYHLPGFNSSCLMQPMNHTLTTDRSGLSEEKVNWAYFHAGVSAGMRISRNVKGIDTSWVAFNKPSDLTNRHAGLLLALGLSGHLRSLAKWLSFKYLTPKHNMTSVGLLLGLSASYIGSMDSLITRMLSVHITRMLPPGAAELNVSPITQTAGLMGIGLLYYNTQHRRMSEVMLSEIEFLEVEDPDSGPDQLRDESYRLTAGFALGFINLCKGKDLRGLYGMGLPSRLLAVAVGPRPVGAVHVFDRATAGAIIAIALVYMKSGDKAIARKIDIPDTEAQFDHVRPDMLLLRAMAKHVILWTNDEHPSTGWIMENLPQCYKSRLTEIKEAATPNARGYTFRTADVPFYNIATGLAWALSLKHAGSGDHNVRDEILAILELFSSVKGGDFYYYDAKLTRSTTRRCIDVLALSASTVMAGTGDLKTLRYLRRLHGRTDGETPYGSHLAAHLAMGVLFLGGGTYTFGSTDLGVAALICAFYPLFPTDVQDNRCHLQAFRHLWVFAAEARCLVVEDIDTHKPITMPITVNMKHGSAKPLQAPCLLPELDKIATVQTVDPVYWRVTLDFIGNPSHLSAFRQNQRIYVRRCPASEAHHSIFSATLAALNDAQSNQAVDQTWQSIFQLPAFKDLDKADMELILPPDTHSSMHMDERGTAVDDRLVLQKASGSNESGELWNLRMLFAWAAKAKNEGDGKLRWIGNEVVEALKVGIEGRMRRTGDGQ